MRNREAGRACEDQEVSPMRAQLIVVAAGIALLLAQAPVRAHHAFAAEFDANKPVKFTDADGHEGDADQSPQLDLRRRENADGTVENWAIEAGSPNILMRRGITQNTAEGWDEDRRRRVSVEGRVAPSQRPGPHAAGRAKAVSRLLRHGRAVRSAAARRGHRGEDSATTAAPSRCQAGGSRRPGSSGSNQRC